VTGVLVAPDATKTHTNRFWRVFCSAFFVLWRHVTVADPWIMHGTRNVIQWASSPAVQFAPGSHRCFLRFLCCQISTAQHENTMINSMWLRQPLAIRMCAVSADTFSPRRNRNPLPHSTREDPLGCVVTRAYCAEIVFQVVFSGFQVGVAIVGFDALLEVGTGVGRVPHTNLCC